MPLNARKEIHAAIAEAMVGLYPDRLEEMAERLARHYHEAGNDAQAVQYLLRATDRLEDEGALDAAIHELRRAIDLMSTNDDRSAVLEHHERLADLCFRNRNLLQGAEWMDRAIKAAESARSDRHIARFCMWRGRMLVAASRVDEGRRWLDQAQHIARGVPDWELSRDVLVATADANARCGEFEKAVGLLREALTLSRNAGDRIAEPVPVAAPSPTRGWAQTNRPRDAPPVREARRASREPLMRISSPSLANPTTRAISASARAGGWRCRSRAKRACTTSRR